MAEYVYNAVQLVQPNQPVLLRDSIPCNKGYVYHRNESGILTLRGIVNCNCGCFARYQVTFNGNIAVPEGTTPGPIAIALTEPDGSNIKNSGLNKPKRVKTWLEYAVVFILLGVIAVAVDLFMYGMNRAGY